MNNKFKYSPGLPGYGTVGADGSAGLLGLSMYFSSFDGILDTNTLASRIDNDELLYGVSGIKIPGWPERTYRDGEIFMDINGAVFSINKSLTNRYEDTTSKLNTSGFFKVGPQQNVDPGFQRYSNNFDNATNIIDTVYTNAVGDYTAFPANIYDDGALYYARINYVGSDVVTDLTSDFYPFDVWTIGSGDANAIALTREKDSNAWHLGNKDGGSQRDVSLYLDFSDIRIPAGRLVVGLNEPRGSVDTGGGTIVGTELELPHTVRKIASAGTRNSHPAVASTTDTQIWQKLKTITLPNGLLGQQRFYFDVDSLNGTDCSARIYRNGVPLGLEYGFNWPFTIAAYQEDITQNWNPGDTCELWVIAGPGDVASVQDFEIRYNDNPTVAVSSINS